MLHRGERNRPGSFVVGVIFLLLISCAGALAMSISNLSSGARNAEGMILTGRHAMLLAESAIAEVLGEFTRTLAARTSGQDLKTRFESLALQGVVAGPDVLGADTLAFEPVRTRGLLPLYGPGYAVGAAVIRPVEYRLDRNFGTLEITGRVTVRDAGREVVWTVAAYHHFVVKCDARTVRVDPVPFQVVPSHGRRS